MHLLLLHCIHRGIRRATLIASPFPFRFIEENEPAFSLILTHLITEAISWLIRFWYPIRCSPKGCLLYYLWNGSGNRSCVCGTMVPGNNEYNVLEIVGLWLTSTSVVLVGGVLFCVALAHAILSGGRNFNPWNIKTSF